MHNEHMMSTSNSARTSLQALSYQHNQANFSGSNLIKPVEVDGQGRHRGESSRADVRQSNASSSHRVRFASHLPSLIKIGLCVVPSEQCSIQ